MSGISDRAGERLKQALETSGAPQDGCVRFTDDGKLMIDKQQLSDEVFEFEGQTVLVMAPAIAEKYAGKTLDYQDEKFFFV